MYLRFSGEKKYINKNRTIGGARAFTAKYHYTWYIQGF